MAAFDNARDWDPSVTEARRLDIGPLRLGSRFHLVSRFFGRDVPLEYEITGFDEPSRLVLDVSNPTFTGRDEIDIESAAEGGSRVAYDASIEMRGAAKLLTPLVSVAFGRTSAKAAAELGRRLNP
jgi:hypothetical protein